MEVAARCGLSPSDPVVGADLCLSRYSLLFQPSGSAADQVSESPRFLIKRRNYKKAFKSLCYLNETPLQAARELYYIHTQIEAEKEAIALQLDSKSGTAQNDRELQQMDADVQASLQRQQSWLEKTGFWGRLWQLGSVPRIRRALVAAFVVMISQQLCGVNIIGTPPQQ